MVPDDSLGMVDALDVSQLPDNFNMSLHHLVEAPDDVAMGGEAVFAHDVVQLVDHFVGVTGGVSDDRV